MEKELNDNFFKFIALRRLVKSKTKALEGRIRAMKSYYSRRLSSLKSSSHKKITIADVLKFCKGRLSDIAIEFLKFQLRKHKKIRWSQQCKDISLSFYFSGPRLYRFLRKIFKLPSKTTLINYIKCAKVRPGISPSVLKQLQIKSNALITHDKQCVLLLDEMSLKNNLYYHRGEDRVLGMVDFGDLRTTKRADSVLVAMLRGIRKKWKQPIFFFFTETKVNPTKLVSIVRNCISSVNKTGMQIVAVTSDQGANFVKCFKDMGCTTDKPSIFVDQKEILVIADVPHLIKSTRNILHDGKVIQTAEGIVSWLPIKECFHLNQEKSMQLIPKIKRKHIYLPPYGGKMKVKLATQVLSHTVGAAIGTLIECGFLLPDARVTETFCYKMDMLFNILNSSTFFNQNHTKNGLKKESASLVKLIELKEWVSNWVIYKDGKDVTNSFKCKNGWIQTINAVLLLREHLSESSIKSLLTRHLCQDPLENFFGMVRAAGALNERPDCSQFCNNFRKLYCVNIMEAPESSNCMDGDAESLLTHNCLQTMCLGPDSFSTNPIEYIHETVPTTINLPISSGPKKFDLIEINAINYVAGRAALKMLEKHPNCVTCQNQCYTLDNNEPYSTFVEKKDYTIQGSGLIRPSKSLFLHVKQCSEIFEYHFPNIYFQDGICSKLVDRFMTVSINIFCSSEIKLFFCNYFARLKIKSTISKWNEHFIQEKKLIQRKKKKILHE